MQINNTKKEVFYENTKRVRVLESHILEFANCAIKKAYLDTLSAGLSIRKVIEDKIYEIFHDGTKKFIKDIKPSIKIDKKIFTI